MSTVTTSRSIERPLVHFEGPWTAREREQLTTVAEYFEARGPSPHPGLEPSPLEAGARWVAVKTPAPCGTLYGTHRLGPPGLVTTARSLPELIDKLRGSDT